MTVNTTDNRWSYAGDGETAEFFYTSRIFARADLKVYVNGALRALDTHYDVSGVGTSDGGRVIFEEAPATGAAIVIIRDVPAEQGLDLAALGSFPAEENEKALDRLTILVQQLLDRHLRTLRQPDMDASDIGALPAKAERAGKVAAYDSNGDPVGTGATVLPTALTALRVPRVNAAGTEYELRTPDQMRVDIGADDAANLAAGTLPLARIADGSLAAAKLASGAVVSHLGYAPLNRAGDTMTGALNMQAAITLSADPAAAMHATTKQYVDGLAAGLGKRGTARAATSADVDLASDLEAGDTVDGVILAAGDLVLVKNQAAAAENGVYVVPASGAATRAPLFDTWDELPGSLIAVQQGDTLADTLWLCAANSGGTLGATAVSWAAVFPGSGGTVSNIATANGIKGGPIVSIGTIELDIDGLTEISSPSLTDDFVAVHHASAAAPRKVALQNIGRVTVSSQSGNFTAGTTPNTLYVATDTLVCTQPAASTVPNGFRLSLKNATDGKSVQFLRAGSDTIDGQDTARVPAWERVELTRVSASAWVVSANPGHMIGAVIPWAGTTLPDGHGLNPGWLWLNGQAVSRTAYAGLFEVIGTSFGVGDGSTTFNVPDLRGRVMAGKDDMGGAAAANRLTSGGSGINGTTLGASGGTQTHTLTIAEMPAHTHVQTVRTGPNGGGTAVASIDQQNVATANHSTNSTGGDGTHQNTQPTIITNFIVKT